jgi:hypothetical protein
MNPATTIGIATTLRVMNHQGRITMPFYQSMNQRASHVGARLLFFDPKSFRRQDGTVVGWCSDTRDHRLASFRLPTVIYDNVFVHLAVKGYVQPLRSYAKEHGLLVFNPIMPGKAAMQRILIRNPVVGVKVPDTKVIHDYSTLQSMLQKHGTVYVKPSGGYGGRMVFRIAQKHRLYHVRCDRFVHGEKMESMFLEQELVSFYQRFLAKRVQLVQEEIPRLTIAGRNMDFRVVLCRDGQGQWNMVGIIPKLAAKEGVVTNLVGGGERIMLSKLQEYFSAQIIGRITTQLKATSLALSNRLRSDYPAFGLVGYDLGVSSEGQVWFIEMNPKPARSLLYPAMKEELAKLLIDYAMFLLR